MTEKPAPTSPTHLKANPDNQANENYTTSDSNYSWSEFASFTDKLDDDDSLDRRPNMTVEEIFARGVEEWKKAREEVKNRRKAAGKVPQQGIFLPKALRGPLYDPHYDAKFDKEVEEILMPKRKSLFNVPKTSSTDKRVSDNEFAQEESFSMPGLKELMEEKKRRRKGKSTTASATETRDATVNDADAAHKKKLKRYCGYFADTIRVLVVLIGSFVLTGLPWWLEDDPVGPREYKFNLTQRNICYWVGSSSILDPLNPCPYRGYISINRKAHNCLTWKEVVENKEWMDALNAEKKKQAGVLPREFLDKVKQMAPLNDGEDYDSPFCRRLGGIPPSGMGGYVDDNTNAPKCFVRKSEDGYDIDIPRISNCWVVPCTITISNECYKQYWTNKLEFNRQMQQRPSP